MGDATRLDRTNIEDILALTPTQEGLLFHYRSGMDAGSYAQHLLIRFAGELDVDAIRAAWRHVALTNEMLRTVFRWEKLEHPVQIVLLERDIPIAVRDCSAEDEAEREKRVESAFEAERLQPADPAEAPFRVLVCVLDERSFALILSWHHILFDGWSNGILLKEFVQAYDACLAGTEPRFTRKTRFRSFVSWHQRANREAERSYWKEALGGLGERALLPFRTAAAAEASRSREPGAFAMPLGPETVAGLNAYAKQAGTTAATVFYAVWALLLHKYGGVRDVVFGTTVSGRTPEVEGIEQMVGMFINTAPLHVQVDEDAAVEEIVRGVGEALRRREPHACAPLTDIARWSGADGVDGLFDTIVVLDNYPLDLSALHGDRVAAVGYRMHESTHYKLTLGISTFGQWEVSFDYDASSLSARDVERLAGHYLHLLEQTIRHPLRTVGELDLATPAEQAEILTVFNRPIARLSQELAHRLFEERASAHPAYPAVICGNRTFTYGEIDARAERLARRLRRVPLTGGERLAALLAERSDEWIVAMLAVLKAGYGYVPIDPDYAPARIAYMLEDSMAALLLVGEGIDVPPSCQGTVIRLGGMEPGEADGVPYAGTEADIHASETPEAAASRIAYVIYTSGSTGAPKGVMTENRHLLAYVRAFQREFKLAPGDVVLQQASCSFDHFVEEVYPALLSGAAIAIARREDVRDPDRLMRLLRHNRVTVVTVQPLLLSELNRRGGVPGVHTYISGGDVLKAAHYDRLIGQARVYNSYGPTEATVCATYWRCVPTAETHAPIGSPIDGYNVYVADRRGKLLPVGVPGEICISGNGVARGYLHNPALTQQKFVPDPYRPGETMYRTGDVGIWQENGTIRFVGRVDEQVKIRGYRIDLREIELALLAHDAVADAVVIAKDDASGEKQLAAYLNTVKETTAYEIREHLVARLPAYMLPSVYYRIGAVPRTSNDKVDKQALLGCTARLPSGRAAGGSSSETAQAVIAVWRDVLKLDEIGPDDSFFDIGGNSLLLMKLQAKLEMTFSAGLTVTDLFSLPTAARQAAWLDARRARREAVAVGGYQPLPEDCFAWGSVGEGGDTVRVHVPPAVVGALDRLAAESAAARYDVMAAMWGFLFTEASGLRTAVIHAAVREGRGALALRLDLDALRNFPGLFAFIGAQRRAAEASGVQIDQQDDAGSDGHRSADEPAVIALDRVDRFVPERGRFETLPFICRAEDLTDNERIDLLRLYELILCVDRSDAAAEDGLGLTLLHRTGRFRPGTPDWLLRAYVDLLRQLSGSGVAT